jgi:F-type H+-transporting ATPase subunit b
MAALGINLGFFLFQVFNFIIVLVVLNMMAYKPIVNALENRKKKIAQSLEDARIAAEARAMRSGCARVLTKAQAESAEKVPGRSGPRRLLDVTKQAEADAVKTVPRRDASPSEI